MNGMGEANKVPWGPINLSKSLLMQNWPCSLILNSKKWKAQAFLRYLVQFTAAVAAQKILLRHVLDSSDSRHCVEQDEL